MENSLATYLHDHLAGAAFAIHLLHSILHRHKNDFVGSFAQSILADVERDRDTLQQFADQMGTGSHAIKDFAAWMGEKTSRIKLGFSPTGDFDLLESLETLALEIQGMLSLWHALQVVTLADPRLGHLDFTELIARAEAQYEKVEDLRLSTATPALITSEK